jgi:hypothetical protein
MIKRAKIVLSWLIFATNWTGAASARDVVYRSSTKQWTLTFSGSDLIYRYVDGSDHDSWAGEAWRTASSAKGMIYSGFFTRYFIAAGEQGNRRIPFELTLSKRACHDRQGRSGSITIRVKFYPNVDGFADADLWGCGTGLPQAAYLVNPVLN